MKLSSGESVVFKRLEVDANGKLNNAKSNAYALKICAIGRLIMYKRVLFSEDSMASRPINAASTPMPLNLSNHTSSYDYGT